MKPKITTALLALFFLISGKGFTQTITQTNLPIVILTSSGTIGTSNIQGSIKIINNATGLNHPSDAPQYQGTIGIKYRGALTNPKKSFSIETWENSSGLSLDTSLLGMPTENDWVLLSSYSDRSFQRDLLGFYLFEQMGNYAPRMRLVEVMLDGVYEGIYLFGEKIKRDANRINVAKLNYIDNTPPQITGGYIFKVDNSTSGYWSSQVAPPFASWGQQINFHYDEPADNTISPVQQAYIKAYIDSFETALNSATFQDTSSTNGWRYYAGKGTFQEYFITNEFMKCEDAYRISTILYKDKSKKLKIGPPWGLELSLYNTASCNASKDTGWAYNFGQSCGADTFLVPFWWKRFTQDSLFMREMKCKYTLDRASFLDTNNIWHVIDSITNMINAQQAVSRNFTKWPTWGTQLVNEPLPVSTNYAEEITKIKAFIRKRISYLDSKWLTPGCVLGMEEIAAPTISVFVGPNPVKELLNYSVSLREKSKLGVTILDVYGRILIEKHLDNLPKSVYQIPLDMSQFSNGIYLVKTVINDSETSTIKVVKE
jgi:hypothetical protein